MPGPNSSPNGDTRIVRGHWNEEFRCDVGHKCGAKDAGPCRIIPLRVWLSKRNKLRTGKTR